MAADIVSVILLVLQIGASIVDRFAQHGSDILELRLKDILAPELRTTVARRAAEAAARAKFGG